MIKFNKNLVFALIGIIAIILAIVCACLNDGYYEANEVYGGDAYTGIQQAAAQTANNVQYLADIARFGFSSVLAVIGLICIAYGIFCKPVDYTAAVADVNKNLMDLKAISEKVALNTTEREDSSVKEEPQETAEQE